MKILFSAVRVFGHVLPLLPLAKAARDAGHHVALMTHPSMAYLGQFVAAALDVPLAAHGATLPLIEPLAMQFGQRALVKFGEHGLAPSAAFAYVDPWPDSLPRSTDRYPAPRMPIRPEPHAGEGPSWTRPLFRESEDRPTVLLSLRAASVGAAEVVADPAEIGGAIQKVLEEDTYRTAAQTTAKEISAMPSPRLVLEALTATA